MTRLPVAEVFGPTWQGEGPYVGIRTGFVRLGLCNLTCEWCDTPYTWDATRFDIAKEAPLTEISAIHDQLERQKVEVVCLSGGEPLIHRAHLGELMDPRWAWHVETNGTINPPLRWADYCQHTSVSPKINTRDPAGKRLKWPALERWNDLAQQGLAAFKFVVLTPADLDLVAEVANHVGIAGRDIWIMPEGTTPELLLARHRMLASHIEDRGWQTTTRLHTLLWGQERGR